LAGRHLYEITEYEQTPDVARAVCRFVKVVKDE
jgi:hypothetical protein